MPNPKPIRPANATQVLQAVNKMRRLAARPPGAALAEAIAAAGLPDDLVTVAQAAAYAQCSEGSIRRRAKTGDIRPFDAGNLLMVPLGDVVRARLIPGYPPKRPLKGYFSPYQSVERAFRMWR